MPILSKKYTHDEYEHLVARYMKETGKNVKVQNLPAAELDHLLCSPQEERTRVTSQIPSPVFSDVAKDI